MLLFEIYKEKTVAVVTAEVSTDRSGLFDRTRSLLFMTYLCRLFLSRV